MGWSNTASSVLTANTVIVIASAPNTGVFVYSGTPASGNLIASMTATSGTDPYGNGYGEGIIAYAVGATGDAGLDQGALRLGHGSTSFLNGAYIQQLLRFGGDIYLNTGTGDATHLDAYQAHLIAGTAATATGSATSPRFTLSDAALSSAADLLLSGTVLATDLAGNAETWHTPSLNAGWALGPGGGTVQALQYRHDAQNNVVLVGTVHTTSTTPSATIFTLPAGYRPTIEQRPLVGVNQGGSISSALLQVTPAGAVGISPNLTTSGSDVEIYATLPLGIIP
jgi:hypothetical protein